VADWQAEEGEGGDSHDRKGEWAREGHTPEPAFIGSCSTGLDPLSARQPSQR
jgi:hypothetical protein